MYDIVAIDRIFQMLKSTGSFVILLFTCLNVLHLFRQNYVIEYETCWYDSELLAFVIIFGITDLFKHLMDEHFYDRLAEKDAIIQQANKDYHQLEAEKDKAAKKHAKQEKCYKKQIDYLIRGPNRCKCRHRKLSFTAVEVLNIGKTFEDAATSWNRSHHQGLSFTATTTVKVLRNAKTFEDTGTNCDLPLTITSQTPAVPCGTCLTSIKTVSSSQLNENRNQPRSNTSKPPTPSPRTSSLYRSNPPTLTPSKSSATPQNCSSFRSLADFVVHESRTSPQHINVAAGSSARENPHRINGNENVDSLLPKTSATQPCFSSSTPVMPRRTTISTNQSNRRAPPATPSSSVATVTISKDDTFKDKLAASLASKLYQINNAAFSNDISNNVLPASSLPLTSSNDNPVSINGTENISSTAPPMLSLTPITSPRVVPVSTAVQANGAIPPPPPPPLPANFFSTSTPAMSPRTAAAGNQHDRRFQSPAPSDIPSTPLRRRIETPYSQDLLAGIRAGVQLTDPAIRVIKQLTLPQHRNDGNPITAALNKIKNKVNAHIVDDDKKESDSEWED